ncbi:rhombosortase [Pelagicoccus mobilis]|uniref:Rhombosortase n=1 Tax=Pelagicoccus mobilis TaxID=415221 RepID=A0A934RZ38_9BACT|nr:rhombosortase [Pelagicoccus mobilis]MBK1878175.1 rhombosortase [Pelagicoccus mobilis]
MGSVALGIHFFGETAFAALCWKQACVGAGEGWRLMTGHLVHVSSSHLVYDLGAFLVLGSFVEVRGRSRFVWIVLGTVVLSFLFLEWNGRFSVYCGLSGIDMGLLVGAATILVRDGSKGGDRVLSGLGWLGLFAALAKIVWELSRAEAVFLAGEMGGFEVATEAHLAGAAAALAALLLDNIPTGRFKGRQWQRPDRLKRLDNAF